jgi:hypothetical protein
MATPTIFQKRVIGAITDEMRYWEMSNDVHSPSHCTSIEYDMFSNLEGHWSEEQEKQLDKVVKAVQHLHAAISRLEPSGRS